MLRPWHTQTWTGHCGLSLPTYRPESVGETYQLAIIMWYKDVVFCTYRACKSCVSEWSLTGYCGPNW